MKLQRQINVANFHPSDGFIKEYQKLIQTQVIPYQYRVLWDKEDSIKDDEKSHVVKNFINAARALRGEDVEDGFKGMVFQDSDAGKWLEAVAYSLAVLPNKELEGWADELIEIIAAAQDSDGYLDTYFTIKDRDKRWTNLLEAHELYCAGHLMEAAVAYYNATGKDRFLKVMEKNAEHIYKHFVVENNPGYPGHPEVELALLKMYKATGNVHCLELAKRFLDLRGTDDFYIEEKNKRDWTVWGNDACNGAYQQSHAPVREQMTAVGHSVRAVYLYTAMADLMGETEDKELKAACEALWESITQRQMYVTGAIGSTVHGEAFSVDYDLPNDTAYAETCASCGLMFFASRMLEQDVDSRYSDVIERAFYNTVLAGMSQDGKNFFYVNPLEVIPGISGCTATHWHDKPVRPGWFACACCPPNVARTISGLGMYAYGASEDTGFCHLYAAGDVEFGNGLVVSCDTGFPYDFKLKYTIKEGLGKLAVRIPGWSSFFKANSDYVEEKGYAYFNVKAGDVIEISLDGSAKYVYTSSKVAENTGCAAILRGALVYCFEGLDNKDDVLSLGLDCKSVPSQSDVTSEKEAGLNYHKLLVDGCRIISPTGLYSFNAPSITREKLTAIPYYMWGNRGLNQMRVWLPIVSLTDVSK